MTSFPKPRSLNRPATEAAHASLRDMPVGSGTYHFSVILAATSRTISEASWLLQDSAQEVSLYSLCVP